MSTLVIGPNGLTERHDALLSMLFEWSQTPAIAKAVIQSGAATEAELDALAGMVRAVGQGKAGLAEMDAANLVLNLFLTSRTVRRMIAKTQANQGTFRKGACMLALSEMRADLEMLVTPRIGRA